MKALSVGLVKGSIDEVDKRVHMTWVQPRVLDLQQVIMSEILMLHPFSGEPGVLWRAGGGGKQAYFWVGWERREKGALVKSSFSILVNVFYVSSLLSCQNQIYSD